ncbi:MAG TPA: hypothetical protein VKE40_06980 [Gemmataceae bacterium]|nr:hypothetical protein [Gemmataceae bacterium]
MADLKRHPDPAWERFFEFLFPCERDSEEEVARAEIQDDLRRLGIDIRKAVSRVQQAVAAAKGKTELAAARSRRLGIMSQLGQVVVPGDRDLRARLKAVIAGKFEGTVQAAYFRKLESAATDEDLQSLLDDIHQLDALSEEPVDGDPTAG